MRSQLLNATYWYDYCDSIFGVSPRINRTLAAYSANHMAGTNTIFTNGGEDPWQWATELHPKWGKGRNQQGYMADCADCGHCADLYTPKDSDPKELQIVRTKVFFFLEDILKGHQQPAKEADYGEEAADDELDYDMDGTQEEFEEEDEEDAFLM